MPIEGDCPFCGVNLKWGDLIRKMKGCKMGDEINCYGKNDNDGDDSDVDNNVSDVDNNDSYVDYNDRDSDVDDKDDKQRDVDDQKSDESDDVVCVDHNPPKVDEYPSWFDDCVD